MSLLDIKQHMVTVKMASLSSLCRLFNADPDTLRCMLQHWVRKGKIRQCVKKPACGSTCFQCPSLTTEFYEWVDGTREIVIL
ncbi:MAG: FeoC-like transcriptional regulator [Gammaproteobacteria bacterium]|nr:FeoC-like transcriptional regulator [Gammaproteobacteria bacterium]MCW5583150.1 FeoC-like transcriptional regulator [Gammaproteobacteria bacterium]